MTARKPSKGKPTPAEMAEGIYRRLGQIHPLDICFCGLVECCGDSAVKRAILEVLSDGAPRGKA